MPELIDRFIPRPEVAERHEVSVAAPADLVFEAAVALDLHSVWPIEAIFRLRALVLRARADTVLRPRGLVPEMLSLGWGRLAERPGRELVMGAVTRPWEADVVFRAIGPDRFAEFSEPDEVKIAWTLEAEPIDDTHTRFRTQTRVLPTDEQARRRFKRYWRIFGIGIVLIRWLVLPAVRRDAERRFRRERLLRERAVTKPAG